MFPHEGSEAPCSAAQVLINSLTSSTARKLRSAFFSSGGLRKLGSTTAQTSLVRFLTWQRRLRAQSCQQRWWQTAWGYCLSCHASSNRWQKRHSQSRKPQTHSAQTHWEGPKKIKSHEQFVNTLYDHDTTHLPSPGSVQVAIERFPEGKFSYQHGGVYQHSDAKVRQQNLPRHFCVHSPPPGKSYVGILMPMPNYHAYLFGNARRTQHNSTKQKHTSTGAELQACSGKIRKQSASNCGKEYQARQESNKVKNVQVCLFMVVTRTGDFVMMLQHPRTCYLFFSLHLGLFPKLYKTTTFKKHKQRRQSKTGNIGAKKYFSGLVCYFTLLYSSQLASSVRRKSLN